MKVGLDVGGLGRPRCDRRRLRGGRRCLGPCLHLRRRLGTGFECGLDVCLHDAATRAAAADTGELKPLLGGEATGEG